MSSDTDHIFLPLARQCPSAIILGPAIFQLSMAESGDYPCTAAGIAEILSLSTVISSLKLLRQNQGRHICFLT
ncbi:hypothetical protein IMY05_015G0007500 [Salix suchowensis]|nr:hypothetical protein IMY05_015G0007500 [Salix suchowensis]